MPNEATMFDVGWDFENSSVQNGVVRNVLLCGNRSKNGYDFEKGAFGKDPTTLYDNIPVYLNHSWDQRVETYAGYVTNVKLVDGKPRGDIVVLTKTEAGKTFLAIAEAKPPNVGMSHVAQYKFNSSGNVETVLKVQSVDMVVNPATTKNLHEHTRKPTVDPAELKAFYEGQLKDLQEKLAAEQAAHTATKESLTKAQEASKVVCDERDALKLENDTFKAAAVVTARKESALAAIKDSGLNLSDKAICSDVFVESVVKADDEGRKALIADRLALAKVAPNGNVDRKESTNVFDPAKAVKGCFN
jgi:hypothetical protein